VRVQHEIRGDLFTLHIARGGRRGRHLILFQVESSAPDRIVVLRILHDSMDIARHLPSDETDE